MQRIQLICGRTHSILSLALILPLLGSGCDNSSTNPTGKSTSGPQKESPSDAESTATNPEESSTPVRDMLTQGNGSGAGGASSLVNLPTDTGNSYKPLDTGVSAPQTEPETAVVQDQTELRSRPFATIQPTDSKLPSDLVLHLQEVDEALGDLVTAGSHNIVEKDAFIQFGMRLGKMKLDTGERLANSPDATADQRKAGVLAQLIALSHMSGLGDVESAQQLQRLAENMSESSDPDLEHQSRIVLLGFELQNLQNGIQTAPNEVVTQVEGLFKRPEDRNFPEFMIVQQATFVLGQMGFSDAADRVRQILVEEYQDSEDPELRTASWNFATQNSQALQNYNVAYQSVDSPGFNPGDLVAAARGLYEAFPSAQTLEALSRSIVNIEYGGHVNLSRQLADFIDTKLAESNSNGATRAATEFIDAHKARVALVGSKLELKDLLSLDGEDLDWTNYEGKVLLIDFWATWCVPCLEEIPNLRKVSEQYPADELAVIAINIDENEEAARQFITNQEFPWTNFRFSDATGFNAAFLKENGVVAIPFLMLVGKDGVVQNIHVRGNALKDAVAKSLGEETLILD